MKKLETLDIETIQNKIIELKKELIVYQIKKATKQNIKTHIIKNIKHEISQMLTLETQILS